MQRKRVFFATLVLTILLLLSLSPITAQGPEPQATSGTQAVLGAAFTYQGRLVDDGTPVDDTCDFQFGLWDDLSAGSLVVGPLDVTGASVSDGRFTVQLDFGNVFDGTAYWLEIAVQCSGDADYTTLSPRQPLTASPYALYSLSTGALQGDPVATTDPTTSQVLEWDGSAWVAAADDDTLAGLSCANGQIAEWDGSAWVCSDDDDTTYSDGAGLVLTGTVFSADPTVVQWRVSDACGAGFAIRQVNQDGSVVCEADDDTLAGLSCANGQIAEWNGANWVCGDDDVGAGDFWSLSGNAGTVPGTNFVGTSDNQALQLHVNGTRALRLEPTTGAPNVIGGAASNTVEPGVSGATIGGGSGNLVTATHSTIAGGENNTASGDRATVGGGESNLVTATHGTIGGGWDNTASGTRATIGGGAHNVASALVSTVGGGAYNTASEPDATVSGGSSNFATGRRATVPGGYNNTAAGDYSFAAGRRARANHDGAFVWADSTDAYFVSERDNQARVRADGGVYFDINENHWFDFRYQLVVPPLGFGVLNTSTGAWLSAGGTWIDASDRNKKENFAPVDGLAVLDSLADLPITTWNYKVESPSIHHMGPVAQDFYAVFGLGGSDTHIAPADTSGVALAAIQGLYEQNQALQKQVNDLEARLAALETAGGNAAPARPWSDSLLPGAGILLAMMGVVWVTRLRGGGR